MTEIDAGMTEMSNFICHLDAGMIWKERFYLSFGRGNDGNRRRNDMERAALFVIWAWE
jgi:hypothetical protein